MLHVVTVLLEYLTDCFIRVSQSLLVLFWEEGTCSHLDPPLYWWDIWDRPKDVHFVLYRTERIGWMAM